MGNGIKMGCVIKCANVLNLVPSFDSLPEGFNKIIPGLPTTTPPGYG